MLAMISLLRRSEASARAAIARSSIRNLRTASSIADAMNAVSAPSRRPDCDAARAAAKNFAAANASNPTNAATTAVRPRKR